MTDQRDPFGYPRLPGVYAGPVADFAMVGGAPPSVAPLSYDPQIFGGLASPSPSASPQPAYLRGGLSGLNFTTPEMDPALGGGARTMAEAALSRFGGAVDPNSKLEPENASSWSVLGDRAWVNPPGDDTPAFSIPNVGGPDYVGPGPGYHQYRAEASTPLADARTLAALTRNLIQRPTLDAANRPAQPGGALNDGGISPLPGVLDDKVQSYLARDAKGGTVVANVTIPGRHLLNPGYVAQYIERGPDGIRLITSGEGNAAIQKGPGSWLGSKLFGMKNDALMRKSIYEASQPRRR